MPTGVASKPTFAREEPARMQVRELARVAGVTVVATRTDADTAVADREPEQVIGVRARAVV